MGQHVTTGGMTMSVRHLLALGAAALFAVSCVTNPITGKQQFSMVGKGQLLALAREAVPSQFAADYGVAADAQANAYVTQIGRKLVATLTPADVVFPDMPFSFQVVNAVYVNAYAFPDGTIAITRGMLAELENEAQLAAVLGHEIAHVNCGHTASAMSKSMVYGALLAGAQGYLTHRESQYTELAGLAGQIGGAVVLASYSRDQERQADQGGMMYMVRAGYDPRGMVDLTRLLVRLGNANPSALERMFATHPMSTERLQAAEARARSTYAGQNAGIVNQEAFLAATAAIRKNKEAFKQFAKAETQLASRQYAAARATAQAGLGLAPDDTVGLLLLAQASQQANDTSAARAAATRALQVNPTAIRAHGVLAQAALVDRDYGTALQHLNAFGRQVPGDLNTLFCRGLAYDGLGQRREAAIVYDAYLQRAGVESTEGQYALGRLQQFAR
jgi:predicted Zn-dependent protease